MSKKLFISKPLEEVSELVDFCQLNGYELIAESFLSFKAIPFTTESPFDVVFFGSKRAVEFYLQNEKINDATLIACVGEATAKTIKLFGYNPSFIGEKAGDIASVAEDFKIWLKNKKVLFAQAKESNRSISKVLDSTQYQEISVYETIISSKKISSCDAYIFTSPSNARGFFFTNQITENKSVISWGTSTKQFLEENLITVNYTLTTASFSELIQTLRQLNF